MPHAAAPTVARDADARRACHPEQAMSNLSRRPGSGLNRSARERRAFQLVAVGGTAAAVAVVTLLLAIFGVMGYGVYFLALIVAVGSGLLFRRAVGQ
jgi:hypothetical protein